MVLSQGIVFLITQETVFQQISKHFFILTKTNKSIEKNTYTNTRNNFQGHCHGCDILCFNNKLLISLHWSWIIAQRIIIVALWAGTLSGIQQLLSPPPHPSPKTCLWIGQLLRNYCQISLATTCSQNFRTICRADLQDHSHLIACAIFCNPRIAPKCQQRWDTTPH